MTMSVVALVSDLLVPMKTDRKRISPANGKETNIAAIPA
jgi:hypothetical protein